MGCMGGGSDIEVPGPSPTEEAIRAKTLQNMTKSENLSAQLMPEVMRQMGYIQNPITTEAQAKQQALADRYAVLAKLYNGGNSDRSMHPQWEAEMRDIENQRLILEQPTYRKATGDELMAGMTPLERAQYENAMLQADYTGKALRGELEVSPALERSIQKQAGITAENIARSGGLNSTPGIQRERAFNEYADLVREEARRGMISAGTSNEIARGGLALNQTNSAINNLGGVSQTYLPYVGAYNSTLAPYLADRQMQFQANATNAQADAQRSAGLMGGIGNLIGMGTGIGLAKWLQK